MIRRFKIVVLVRGKNATECDHEARRLRLLVRRVPSVVGCQAGADEGVYDEGTGLAPEKEWSDA